MIRHIQKYLDINGPIPGDCWRTCIAMLLNIEDLESVPHFLHLYGDDEDQNRWYDETIKWVEAHLEHEWKFSWTPVRFPVYTNNVHRADLNDEQQYVILSGKSPRGDWGHCVLADRETGEMVADPHPSGAGLDSETEPLWDIHVLTV